MELPDELKKMLEGKKKKIVKTIPMTMDWKTAWKNLDKATKEAEQADRKRQHLRKYFWTMVEHDTNDFRDMNVNKNGDIEITEDEE